MLPHGSLNLPPQSVCAVLLVATTFLQRKQFFAALSMACNLNRLGFLMLFLIYAIFSAFLFTRLFAGQILVIFLNNPSAGLRPVTPTSANLTQAIYVALSVSVAFVFAIRGQSARFRRVFLSATLFAAMLLIVSGVMDLILTVSGHAALLSAFHNAKYAQLTDVKEAGRLRVVGFMPEASKYGEYCVFLLSFLVFCFGHYDARLQRLVVPATIAGLTLMIFLSTSSTGFIGLIIIVVLLFLKYVAVPLAAGRLRRGGVMVAIGGGVSAGVVYGFALLLAPHFIIGFTRLLDSVLLNKTQSLSYIERSSWTRAGWHAFENSYAIGVGVGSVRTSDWFVNLLASVGIFGVILFLSAIGVAILALRKQPDARLRNLGGSLILVAIPVVAVKMVSGTTSDPGVFGMALLGLVAGLSRTLKPSSVSPEPLQS